MKPCLENGPSCLGLVTYHLGLSELPVFLPRCADESGFLGLQHKVTVEVTTAGSSVCTDILCSCLYPMPTDACFQEGWLFCSVIQKGNRSGAFWVRCSRKGNNRGIPSIAWKTLVPLRPLRFKCMCIFLSVHVYAWCAHVDVCFHVLMYVGAG